MYCYTQKEWKLLGSLLLLVLFEQSSIFHHQVKREAINSQRWKVFGMTSTPGVCVHTLKLIFLHFYLFNK